MFVVMDRLDVVLLIIVMVKLVMHRVVFVLLNVERIVLLCVNFLRCEATRLADRALILLRLLVL